MIGTQALLAFAVALGAAALFTLMRSGHYQIAINALDAPSNADIYPLENRMLAYGVAAPLLGCAALLFAGASARRMVRFRTFVLSLVLWVVMLGWALALIVPGIGGAWDGPGGAVANAWQMLGLGLVLPPLFVALGFWLVAIGERGDKGETQ